MDAQLTGHARNFSARLLEHFLDVDVGLFGGVEFEELRRLEIEHARDDGVGELLDAHVVDIDRLVVKLAAVGDRVFQPGDASLQLLERLIGFQIRILLGEREQAAYARAQAGFGGAQRGNVLRFARRKHARARIDDFLQGVLLEFHVLLAGFDELR